MVADHSNQFQFDNTYAKLPERFYARLNPTPVRKPGLIKINRLLANNIGLDPNFLETTDGDEDVNIFFGLDLELNPEFSVLFEYNSALNENDMTAKTMSISRGGYLNAALRWSFVESLHLELDLNNLLFDDEKVEYFKREIKLTYIEYF